MSDANGVISIVFKGEEGHTIMQSYNSNFQRIATLVENGDDWTLLVGSQHEFNVKGAGCEDPITFVEHIVSPPLTESEATNNSALMSFTSKTEKWEVFDVK